MKRWKLPRKPTRAAVIAVILLCLGFGALQLLPSHSSSPSLQDNPLNGTALEIHELHQATSKLHENLLGNSNSSKRFKEYLALLQTITTACGRIQTYQEKARDSTIPADTLVQINNSNTLCSDLSDLASDSLSLFEPLEPLLTTDATPRRYQTLPPWGSRMRMRHIAAAKQALDTLKSGNQLNKDFPSITVQELKVLNEAMDKSKGLSYLPTLNAFQLKTAGDRQHYWLSFADISSLVRTLQNQQDSYCKAVPNLAFCK